jgi:branched-chain amino acid transport system substrate-binding protein
VQDEAVSLDRVSQILEPVKRLRLVILDACRDNPFARSMRRTLATRAVRSGHAEIDERSLPPNTLVAYAQRAGATAEDGTGANSPYTTALLKHLPTPGLDIELALRRVRDDVLRMTRNRQEPYRYGSLGGGEIALVARREETLSPASGATREWSAVDKTSVAELETFVRRHGNSDEAEYARARIEAIRKQVAVSASPPSPPAHSATPVAPSPRPTAPSTTTVAIPPSPPMPGPTELPSPAPGRGIKIGIAGPLSGGGAAFGAQIKNGAAQAIEDVNAAGGVLGQKIVTPAPIGDDRADPREGVAVANKLVGEGVRFVVGHFHSGVTIPASEVYQANGILQITPSATNPNVTDRNMWNMFRTCGRDDQQGIVAGGVIAEKFKGKRIAIVHDKTRYGQGLAEETRRTMNAKGLQEVLYEGVNVGDKDYAELVSKVKAARADLVYWGGLYDTGGRILRQLRDHSVKATFMGGDGITDDEFAAIAGPGVEGTLMTYGPDPRNRPEARAVVAKFRARSFEPQAYTLYSYAAVEIIKQAAEGAKSVDPKKVAEQMKSGQKFKTVIGEISYDKKGDVTRLDYVVYVWKKDPSGRIGYTELK